MRVPIVLLQNERAFASFLPSLLEICSQIPVLTFVVDRIPVEIEQAIPFELSPLLPMTNLPGLLC